MMWDQHAPGQVVASFDKALYDDFDCLAASNKQQILFMWGEVKRQTENLKCGYFEARATLSTGERHCRYLIIGR